MAARKAAERKRPGGKAGGGAGGKGRPKLEGSKVPQAKAAKATGAAPESKAHYLGQMQVLADQMRVAGEASDHKTLKSLAAVIEGIAMLGIHDYPTGPSDSALRDLEHAVARVLHRHGVALNGYRTMRLRRGKKLGSVQATLATELCEYVEQIISNPGDRDLADRLAGALAMELVDDWPGNSRLRSLTHADLTTRIRSAIANQGALRSTDPEQIVKLALRGVGADLIGLTDEQMRTLFDFRTKRVARGQT